jgi:hypothetical protein
MDLQRECPLSMRVNNRLEMGSCVPVVAWDGSSRYL